MIPEYINFKDAPLAIVCCQWLSEMHGWSIDQNISLGNISSLTRGPVVCAEFSKDKVCHWWDRDRREGAPDINSFDDFKGIVNDLIQIKVNRSMETVEFSKGKIKIGCTEVSNEIVEKIAGRLIK